jgi:cysteine desulfurase/selenocysteine lyase
VTHVGSAPALDVHALREREFPWAARGEQVYLNHASTGPLPARAVEALARFNARRAEPWRIPQEDQFGTLDRAREHCARLIGADTRDVALMVNTSYGLNLAARALPFAPGDVVVTSDREFPSNIYPWMALEKARGVSLRVVPTRDGLADEEAILAALDQPRVRGLVLSWVSFESGARIDLARLGEACRARDIRFVVDAIQGVGAVPLDVATFHADVVACGGQKWLLSPWGTGFVWIRPDLVTELEPGDVSWMCVRGSDDFSRLIDYDFTWRDDARRFEVITLPFQDFAGMNASLDLFEEVGLDVVYARVRALTTRIVEWTRAHDDVRLVTPADPSRRAGIVAIVPRDARVASARLTAAGVSHSLREGAIRLSPQFYNTEDEIDRALELLAGSR